ncbi:MAG: HNH endonuclease [Caldilinea sp. CFX5]|nr:HNH endonuclease [Caldilinea sp. CFX5]
MATRRKISDAIRQRLEAIAGYRCSYCRSPMAAGVAMVVEHIIPLAAGGSNGIDNLCLACYRCNQFKGSKITAVDPQSAEAAPLFNPHTQSWAEHFQWAADGLEVFGLTASARATIALLRMNDPWLVQARQIWRIAGIHPPLDL